LEYCKDQEKAIAEQNPLCSYLLYVKALKIGIF